jgi:hypothetical protein
VRKQIGDGWWAAAGKEKDKSPARQAFMRRAYSWYKEALPKAPEVKGKMTVIAKQIPDIVDPWAQIEVPDGVVKDEPIRLAAGKTLWTRRFYRGGVEVTVVARAQKNGIRLTAGGGLVNFNANQSGDIFIHRPDSGFFMDARATSTGPLTATVPRNLEPNMRYTFRWQLTPAGMKVWVDDELIFEKEEAYDLSTPRPVGLNANFGPVEVKSLVVKPLAAAPKAKE